MRRIALAVKWAKCNFVLPEIVGVCHHRKGVGWFYKFIRVVFTMYKVFSQMQRGACKVVSVGARRAREFFYSPFFAGFSVPPRLCRLALPYSSGTFSRRAHVVCTGERRPRVKWRIRQGRIPTRNFGRTTADSSPVTPGDYCYRRSMCTHLSVACGTHSGAVVSIQSRSSCRGGKSAESPARVHRLHHRPRLQLPVSLAFSNTQEAADKQSKVCEQKSITQSGRSKRRCRTFARQTMKTLASEIGRRTP